MSKTPNVLYAGDDALSRAACYLGGILTRADIVFDYVPCGQPIGTAVQGANHDLYIISDFSVNGWTIEDFELVLERIDHGAGLLMIGGWDSFHGLEGGYHTSPLGRALPVRMEHEDDRVNSSQPYVILKTQDHPIVNDLPWGRPPTVGGFNRFAPKPDAQEILSVRLLEINVHREHILIDPQPPVPLLVVGEYGQGRTAAFASDVAPHWVGTLVDWGDTRIHAQADGGIPIEVGNHYAELFTRMVRWTMGEL